MMTLLSAALGAAFGYLWAHKRGGNGFDKAQHAAVLAVLFALAAMIASIVVLRLASRRSLTR